MFSDKVLHQLIILSKLSLNIILMNSFLVWSKNLSVYVYVTTTENNH